MPYRDGVDASRRRYEAQRERALSRDERLGVGAFLFLPTGVAEDLRQLRDRCDDLGDPPGDLSRGFELWAAYEEALRSAFEEVLPPAADELGQVQAALVERHQLAGLANRPLEQREAAAMVGAVREVDPQAKMDWLGGAILVAKLHFDASPVVAVIRPVRMARRCHVAVAIDRRRPRVTLREVPRLSRALARSPDSIVEAFASRFQSDHPGAPIPTDVLHPAITLSAFRAEPVVEIGDGFAQLSWRPTADESLTYPLRLVAALRRAHPPRIAGRTPSQAPKRKRHRRWPPPAK